METNRQIAKMFRDIADLLDIKGESAFRINGYRRAAAILEHLDRDVKDAYRERKIKGLISIAGIGEGSAKKIEEFIKRGRIKYFEELKEETAIRQIVTHFFATKGLDLRELKENAKKRKIIYSRYTKPAKQLLELAGGLQPAKEAIDKVAAWANSRKLDYAIETIFKKWLELDRLKPKERVKKAFYQGDPMVYSELRKRWYVVSRTGEWLMFAGKEAEIEWRIIE